MGDGDDDQGDEEPGPVASSTGHATSGTRIEQHANVPLRCVRAGEVRREEFLYELKRRPAGGRTTTEHGWTELAVHRSRVRNAPLDLSIGRCTNILTATCRITWP